MKAVILAGGLGSRLSEETAVRPKPMVEIGGKPIIWHIMKIYSAHGINDFIVCLGYKGYIIKEYFANYYLHTADVTINMDGGKIDFHSSTAEPWRVTLVDTGDGSMTGGRLKAVAPYIGSDPFCFTYGDGLSNVDITDTVRFHKEHGKLATVTAIQPPGRYGAFKMNGHEITEFVEKPPGDHTGWINGGFFVLSPGVLPLIDGPATSWELEPMHGLARDGELNAYFHYGFWHAMDTLRDKQQLEQLWSEEACPWKIW